MPSVAESVVRFLEVNGVPRVWGLPGDSLNGFTDAVRRSESLTWMHVRHEEAAAFAAAAEAETTGELAVCAASCGPGNTHLVNGLYDANRARVPVLAIASHIPSAEIGTNYFQETHPTELFRECSVYVELVSDVAQMPRVLEIATRTAIERRGVAVVVVSGDVLLAKADDDRAVRIRPTSSSVLPSEAELDEAAALLDMGEKVTILAGAGVAGAHDELIALAERLSAPVVHAMRGKEHVEWENPYDVGMTGLLGFASGYRAMEACDTLLMLGTDFPYPQFYPDGVKVVQVDVRGEQLGRRHPVDVGLRGTVRETAQALLERLAPKTDRRHLEKSLEHYRSTRDDLDGLTHDDGHLPMHPQYVTRMLDELADDDAIFIPDVGTPVIWASRHLTMNGRRRLVGSFWHGTMAAALPWGIGAQAAHPGRQVVSMAGDGGLAMLMGELLTLRQQRLPVKVIVFNNSSLAFVEVEMKAAGIPDWGTDLSEVDFAAIATATGALGIRVERPEDLRSGMEQWLAHDGPAVLDVVVDRHELSMPPSITAAQAKGFALFAAKTVLSGRGDELVDLAKGNLRQLFR